MFNLLVIFRSYKGSIKTRLLDDQIKVQISIDRELRDKIEDHAQQLGFGSIQHFTKVLYKTVINENSRFNLLSPTNQIAGTHVTEQDFKNYQRNKLGKYLRSMRHDELDSLH